MATTAKNKIKTDAAGRRVKTKGEAPLAYYLDKPTSDVSARFAAFVLEQTGLECDPQVLQLSHTLRSRFQQDPREQDLRASRKTELEDVAEAKAERKTAREEKRAAKAAKPAKAEAKTAPSKAAAKPATKKASAKAPAKKATATRRRPAAKPAVQEEF